MRERECGLRKEGKGRGRKTSEGWELHEKNKACCKLSAGLRSLCFISYKKNLAFSFPQ